LVLATQGLGLALPNIDQLLPDVDIDLRLGVLQSLVDDASQRDGTSPFAEDSSDSASILDGTDEFSSSFDAYEIYKLIRKSQNQENDWKPFDNWGMKLVSTPCGRSIWVSAGLAERAVQEKGMDALKRLPNGWTMELENDRLVYVNEINCVRQYEAPADRYS